MLPIQSSLTFNPELPKLTYFINFSSIVYISGLYEPGDLQAKEDGECNREQGESSEPVMNYPHLFLVGWVNLWAANTIAYDWRYYD
jgi:hypothetical protein